MMRAVCCCLLMLPAMAMAGWSDAFKKQVLCEHYLTGASAQAGSESLAERVFERPFTFAYRSSAVEPEALKWLKLDAVPDRQSDRLILSLAHGVGDIQPLTLRLQLFTSGRLTDLYTTAFPDETPTFWDKLSLSPSEEGLSYEGLVAKRGVPKSPGFEDGYLGFHTDPDPEGVRGFIASHVYGGESSVLYLSLGVDVPCDQLSRFVKPESSAVENVATSAVNYCRVPVLTFVRSALDEDEE